MLLGILFAFNLAFAFLDASGGIAAMEHPMLHVVMAFGLAVIETAIVRYAMQRSPALARFFGPLDR